MADQETKHASQAKQRSSRKKKKLGVVDKKILKGKKKQIVNDLLSREVIRLQEKCDYLKQRTPRGANQSSFR